MPGDAVRLPSYVIGEGDPVLIANMVQPVYAEAVVTSRGRRVVEHVGIGLRNLLNFTCLKTDYVFQHQIRNEAIIVDTQIRLLNIAQRTIFKIFKFTNEAK